MDKPLQKALKNFSSYQDAKNGFICLQCVFDATPKENFDLFLKSKNISVESPNPSKDEILLKILDYYTSKKMKKEAKIRYTNLVDLLGTDLCKADVMGCQLGRFDFIAKADLVSVFADYCADQKINVFKAPKNDEYMLDLFLTKKDPLLKTEAVYILNGLNTEGKYQDLFMQIERSGEIADWKVFVTTPMGALQIGYERLLTDMERLNCWLYIVDPIQQQIFGIQKGSKSNRIDPNVQKTYISSLPAEPIRAPSQVINISKYKFSERGSYKPKRFQLFYIDPEIPEKYFEYPRHPHKYQDIFQTFLIITNESGLTVYSDSRAASQIEDQLISGYLTALDNFVQEMSGQKGNLQEIDYKNFKINAVLGKKVKVIVITTESGDKAFQERLKYFLDQFESEFSVEIDNFIKTGNQSRFNKDRISQLTQEILLI